MYLDDYYKLLIDNVDYYVPLTVLSEGTFLGHKSLEVASYILSDEK